MPTKADLRALRERVGMSQQDLADALGVSAKSVKRWEHEGQAYEAPDDAWVLLDGMLDVQRRMVERSLDVARRQREGLGVGAVRVAYFRDQRMFDEFGRDEGPFGVANASARACAAALEEGGFEVEFRYPSE